MKIGLIQYNPEWEDKKKNQEKLNRLLSQTKREENILVFPEMTLTGFTMNASSFAEPLNGKSFKYFASVAEKNNADVFAGLIEEHGSQFYNSLLHINSKGQLKSVYRKIHPFSYSMEDKHYLKGTETKVTNIDDLKIGLSICYDLRFPELYRFYGKARTELIIVIANWPVTRIEHWRTLLKARAIENQCYVVGVNRVGADPKLIYNGYSSLFDPMGNEMISSFDTETILTADVNIDYVKEVRNKLPFLNDITLI